MSEQNAPRLAPLPEAQWTDEMREMFAPTVKTFGRVFNIFTTLGRHPKLLKRWMVFANHCLLKSSLPPRERELVILRARLAMQFRIRMGTAQPHRARGRLERRGDRARQDRRCRRWLVRCGKTLLCAVDELLETKTLDDAGWAALGEHFNDQQVLDIIFTAGNYATLAMALNACRVEVDDGV